MVWCGALCGEKAKGRTSTLVPNKENVNGSPNSAAIVRQVQPKPPGDNVAIRADLVKRRRSSGYKSVSEKSKSREASQLESRGSSGRSYSVTTRAVDDDDPIYEAGLSVYLLPPRILFFDSGCFPAGRESVRFQGRNTPDHRQGV